jgi:mannose-6-phosphate isomerase-like protein (cupin superfamily)
VFIKNHKDCAEFTANDGCRLRELLHPKNDPVVLPYSIAVARVETGKQTYKHKLSQTEVYYILSGTGVMYLDDHTQYVKPGDVILIPADSVQWLENTGTTELHFIAIVNPPWTEEGDQRQ